MSYIADFEKAVEIGRPPNIRTLFPNSRALLVSGKVIDRALLAKGGAMTIAANGRNHLIIRGVLQAAQRARAAVLIEIARSEGGASAYCPTNYWNIARQVDALCRPVDGAAAALRLACGLEQLLQHCAQAAPAPAHRDGAVLEPAMRRLHADPDADLTVQSLAQACGLSATRFIRRFTSA